MASWMLAAFAAANTSSSVAVVRPYLHQYQRSANAVKLLTYIYVRYLSTDMTAEMDTNYREGRLVCLFSSECVGEECGRGKQVCVPITMKFEKTMR